MNSDWKEEWVDEMGLIVCLSGEDRFTRLRSFTRRMSLLGRQDQVDLKECLRLRFTPSNGEDGCKSATESVKAVTS